MSFIGVDISFDGSVNVERQAQHGQDRLRKPGGRIGMNRKAVGQIVCKGIYLGVSVGAQL